MGYHMGSCLRAPVLYVPCCIICTDHCHHHACFLLLFYVCLIDDLKAQLCYLYCNVSSLKYDNVTLSPLFLPARVTNRSHLTYGSSALSDSHQTFFCPNSVVRDRPFNEGVMVFCFVPIFFIGQHKS